MVIPPRRPGIQRISEEEGTRYPSERMRDLKVGKTCLGCKKYYNYLKQVEKLCLGCKSRQQDLNKK